MLIWFLSAPLWRTISPLLQLLPRCPLIPPHPDHTTSSKHCFTMQRRFCYCIWRILISFYGQSQPLFKSPCLFILSSLYIPYCLHHLLFQSYRWGFYRDYCKFFLGLRETYLKWYSNWYHLRRIEWMKLLPTSMCRFLCGHSFQFIWVNAMECSCWINMGSMFSFVRNGQIVSDVAVPCCIVTNNEGKLPLFHTLSSIWCCQCSRFWPF